MTNIEWTDKSWQVTHGCSKVASGCANCFAIRDAHRMAGHPNPKTSAPRQGLTRRVEPHPKSATRFKPFIDWTGVVRTAPENLDKPLRWKKPQRIFVNSNSDLFHPDAPFEYIAAVYGVMAACPHHTFQVLTKRPERMLEFFEWMASTTDGGVSESARRCIRLAARVSPCETDAFRDKMRDKFDFPPEWPLPNVWHGVSVAEQKDADKNIPILLQVPSAVRFVSYEPAVGPVDLHVGKSGRGDDVDTLRGTRTQYRGHKPRHGGECAIDVHVTNGGPRLDWVIVGGESGPNARPCDVAWIRSVVQQCKAAGVACFVKQVGSNPVVCTPDGRPTVWGCKTTGKGGDPDEWPEDLRVRQFPEVLA